MKFLAIPFLFAFLYESNAEQVPIFPNQYELGFNETSKLGVTGTTKGKIYFDATNNRQVITRQNGQYDRYCGTVFKFTNTPCNQYVADGKRFLDFPDKKYCCFCCDSAHGCGIVKPDWLKTNNATFVGYQKIEPDQPAYVKWDVKGGQDNFYYHKSDSLKTPRRLYQVPDDLMDFTDYYVGIKSESVFKVPSYCTDKCGSLTICAALRGEKTQQHITQQDEQETTQ